MKLNYLIDMPTEEKTNTHPTIVLVCGASTTTAEQIFTALKGNASTIICKVDKKDVVKEVDDMIEATKGTAILPTIPIQEFAIRPTQKPLPTYKQDKKKNGYRRFLR